MKGCKHMATCELYPHIKIQAALQLWKQHYCESDFTTCARYLLSAQGRPVPLTLLPSGKLLRAITPK